MESALENPTRAAVIAQLRGRIIVYWIMTILVVMPIGSGGIAQMMQYFASPHGVVPVLGYPMYFFLILGFWKFFGALTILVPRFPRLKEWAYAGIFFDLTGAAASNALSGGYGAYGFHIIAPLIITGFMFASWALRPASRTLGVISARIATA
ncbi:DoxX family protein [Occallatibacter savannae]|uniref:DoxX family protein n=1 Tax=Occallatibacter savannae TaxID=1002691 RepID=UPI000D690F88|nr:DoxX family protein [Occallatibacter savannae]